MAGTYAHLTLVYKLCTDGDLLDRIDTLTPAVKNGLSMFSNFCMLGAVSPDYPYMTLADPHAFAWANAMHYYKTADFVRRGAERLSSLDHRDPGVQKCIAWLFGYVGHVVTDLCVHPVINLKVGPYAQNKLPHRKCEMHQDVYIFNQQGLGEIVTLRHVRDRGIASCSAVHDRHKLDPDIAALWGHCCEPVPLTGAALRPEITLPTTPPHLNWWHQMFMVVIDKITGALALLPPLSRHFAEAGATSYPPVDQLDPQYIESLPTPEGVQHYDQIFERARQQVIAAWRELGAALQGRDPNLFSLANGDLDTGAKDGTDQLVFWRGVA
jgi:hypothetical protein